ncbi:GmrSD restriction endonuclease domain-containing protein [Microbulbifer yueqingensis]|uniref:GmrSD restriction endonucleases N-terminal domain-containing protein n=1 Tax=Microbulbifer yueqingensis TaxID=658219 RepID=A0A1G8UFK3_9GAMM|nr:DUF262 domain-containing protein [Microbulbifer yueqingensis]SDJ52529.1 hypothetical protein SAMN05216212_0106 [Microbulbifer yueqingensis]
MSQTKTTALNFSNILQKAKNGDFKLPAFQRKWKWTNKQVMSLYDSLRLNYPIGSFLFLTSEDGEKLGPRAFHGAGKIAASKAQHESLILDGQQRITAGLSIVYGLDDVDGNEYYIDVNRVRELVKEQKINIEDDNEVRKFCSDIEIDDGYLVPKKKRQDRKSHFTQSRLLWTPFLTEDKQSQLDDILDEISDKKEKDIIRKIVRKHLKPNTSIQVPVIELGNEFDLSSIARVFTTINTTGKLLTPFELVVAILYPNGVNLEEDINEYKSKYTHYKYLDKNGEILLQVVALLAGKSPKKSELPKNIDHTAYESYGDKAAKMLDEAGEFLTKSLGTGLDVTDKLIPYDAILAPLALALAYINETITEQTNIGAAKSKLRTWFVASALMQRYQEGVHNKQSRDLEDIKRWISEGESKMPSWIKDSYVSKSVIHASPNGAIGKLFLCLLNSRSPNDPMQNEAIGFGDKLHQTQVHHIFPSKWAPKDLDGYTKDSTPINVALNTMLLYSKTNGNWLNFSPSAQIKSSIKALGSESAMEKIYAKQLINDDCINLMKKAKLNVNDYNQFLTARYKEFVKLIADYGISEAQSQNGEDVELEAPSISDD